MKEKIRTPNYSHLEGPTRRNHYLTAQALAKYGEKEKSEERLKLAYEGLDMSELKFEEEVKAKNIPPPQFVFRLNPQLSPETLVHPKMEKPKLRELIQRQLERLSTGEEHVKYITKDLLKAQGEHYAERRKLSRWYSGHVHQGWEPIPKAQLRKEYAEEAKQWITSQSERAHMNKRRARNRPAKENRMVEFSNALYGGGDATVDSTN